jgi:hypothetical protein
MGGYHSPVVVAVLLIPSAVENKNVVCTGRYAYLFVRAVVAETEIPHEHQTRKSEK